MKNSLIRRLLPAALLALVLTSGAWVLWAVMFSVGQAVVKAALFPATPNQQLVFTVDGSALVQSWVPPYVKTVLRTLDGQVVEDDDALLLQDESRYNSDLPGPAEEPSLRGDWPSRIHGFGLLRPEPTYWYLVQDDQPRSLGYFEGYSPETKRSIGYMGIRGFRGTVPPVDDRVVLNEHWQGGGNYAPSHLGTPGSEPHGFLPQVKSAVFVLSDGKLYRFDFAAQAVREVTMPEPVISVATTTLPQLVPDDRRIVFELRLVVRLAKELLITDWQGKQLATVKLPEELEKSRFQVFETTGDQWIVVKNLRGDWNLPTEIYWVDSGGGIARHEQVQLGNSVPADPRLQAWQGALVAPMPLPWVLFSLTARPWLMRPDGTGLYRRSLEETIANSWPAFAVLCVLSMVAAAVGYRRQRRVTGRDAAFWAIFVFLFGLPGLLGYWTHRRWPVSERCSACAPWVPRDGVDCPRCAAPFPEPAARGIEIFA
jgi:hypothetical protein